MSTSLLVQRMKTAAAAKGVEYNIAADTYNKADDYVPGADVVMIGPQIRFALAQLQKRFPEKKFVLIPMQMYGMMDGKKALELAMQEMGDM